MVEKEKKKQENISAWEMAAGTIPYWTFLLAVVAIIFALQPYLTEKCTIELELSGAGNFAAAHPDRNLTIQVGNESAIIGGTAFQTSMGGLLHGRVKAEVFCRDIEEYLKKSAEPQASPTPIVVEQKGTP
ncbi:MAG: hypothetical protein WC759_00075 [Candidatus Micrarchaeia archaeon]|jgi:hypothetical protein